MNPIFHITQREQWEEAKLTGIYHGDTLISEGFIHCSTSKQIMKTANKFFKNQKDLLLLCIDSDKVKSEIRYEIGEVNELFPHIYGALNVDAVFQVVDLVVGEDNLFELPQGVVLR